MYKYYFEKYGYYFEYENFLSYTYIFVFCHSLMYIIGFMWALKTSFPIITTTIIIGMMMMMRNLLLIWYLIKESQRIKKEGKKFATITTTTKMFKFHRWDGPYIFFFHSILRIKNGCQLVFFSNKTNNGL